MRPTATSPSYYEDPETTDRPAGKGESRVEFAIELGAPVATWTRYVTIRWDMGRVQKRLEQELATSLKASDLVKFEGGEADDAASTIAARKDLRLPRALSDWATLEWASSDPGVVGADGAVEREHDRDSAPVTLTATAAFKLADLSEPPARAEKRFTVVAKAVATDTTDATASRRRSTASNSRRPARPIPSTRRPSPATSSCRPTARSASRARARSPMRSRASRPARSSSPASASMRSDPLPACPTRTRCSW